MRRGGGGCGGGGGAGAGTGVPRRQSSGSRSRCRSSGGAARGLKTPYLFDPHPPPFFFFFLKITGTNERSWDPRSGGRRCGRDQAGALRELAS